MKLHPTKIVFGIADVLPLDKFPEGKKRIKMSPNDFAIVHVKNQTSIRAFYVVEEDGKWIPYHEIRANHKAN